jgi:conjugative transfer signal peptidase TraF
MTQPWLTLPLAILFCSLGTAAFYDAASARSRSARLIWISVAVVTIGAGACAIVEIGLRINFTPSMPLGIYRLTRLPSDRIQRGMLVAVCAPLNASELGRRRGYLAAGACPADTEPLLKTVAAVAGDELTISVCGVAVNGRRLPSSRAQSFDVAGRRLVAIHVGRFRLKRNELWLYAEHERSWDSRYFGPVPVRNVMARAIALATVPSWFRSTSGEPSCGAVRFAGPASSLRFGMPVARGGIGRR